MQFVSWDDKAIAQAAVGHDAEDFQLSAAVAGAFAAGDAGAAVHVGFDGAAVAVLYVGDARADGDDLDAELVSRDAGVAVERHFAEVTADVGAADADTVDADERFAGRRMPRLVDFDAREVPGF